MTELEKQLCDALKHISSAIERQLELIAERAPGQFLDKRPVVQALGSHARRANAAIAAAEAAQAVKSEPVAWMCEEMVDGELEREFNGHNEFSGGRTGVPLYAAPQPASAQPATVPDDARECLLDVVSHHQAFVDACRFTLLHVDGENVLYWKHQADVLDRMKGQAERALAAAPVEASGGVSEWRNAVKALMDTATAKEKECDGPDAPGHGHRVPGLWDATGKPCDWCAAWSRLRSMLL